MWSGFFLLFKMFIFSYSLKVICLTSNSAWALLSVDEEYKLKKRIQEKKSTALILIRQN